MQRNSERETLLVLRASIDNVSVTVYKITKTMGVVDPTNAYNKDDQNPQLEGSAESSNPLLMGVETTWK